MSDGKKISLDDICHVAKLARLAPDDARLQKLTDELASILAYVAKISAADTEGVEPLAHAVPLVNVLREDVIEESLPLEKVLQNAPDTDPPYFKVAKILGGDVDSGG